MFYFFLFCLIGCAFGGQVINESNDNWEPESPATQYLGLAAGADGVVPNIRATFSCLGRQYGYFADVDNNCQIFHVCHPSKSANGEPVIYQFSKFCPKTTRFDQRQLTCLSETDSRLIPCGDSIRFYPSTESRLTETPIVQHLENIQHLQEIEQRVEQQVLLEEPRREAAKGIQTEERIQSVLNEGIPAKTIARSEPIPQPIPQSLPFEQRAEPIPQMAEPVIQRNEPIVQGIEPFPQQRGEPIVQQIEPFPQQRGEPIVQQIEPIPQQRGEPIAQQIEPIPQQRGEPIPQQRGEPIVQQIEPLPQLRAEPIVQQLEPLPQQRAEPQTLSVKEPVVPVIQRSNALKQDLTPVTNIENLRAAAPAKNYVAPALALRNTQPILAPVSAPVVTRPVLLESDTTLRRNVPLTQYTRQRQPIVQPIYVQPQQYIQPQQYAQPQQFVQPQQYVQRPQYVQQRQYVQQQPQQYYQPTPQVIRPSQYSAVQNRNTVAQQPRVVYIPAQTTYNTVPQYLRTNIQPQVVRPSANPNIVRIVNKQ